MNNLQELTTLFWKKIIEADFQQVEDMISPNCRIQDALGSDARGVNGIEHCIVKLKELQSKSRKFSLDMTIKQFSIMRNKTQTRFIIQSKIAFKTFVLGVAFEWKHGIVVSMVISKDADPKVFLSDDTEPPPPAAEEMVVTPPSPNALPQEVATAAGITDHKSEENQSSAPAVSEQTTASVSVAGATITTTTDTTTTAGKAASIPPPPAAAAAAPASNASNSKGGWYPGKLLKEGRRKSNEGKSFTSESVDPDTVARLPRCSEAYAFGNALLPPYLVPHPPPIKPTLTVVVKGCTNLKSRLNRLVTRPINSYVTVVLGPRSRSTPIASRSANPSYDTADNKFIFEIDETGRDEFVSFIVKDKHLLDEDILAEVHVPLVSLRNCSNNSEPAAELTLSLKIGEKRLGKGFRAPNDTGTATLRVQLQKVDIQQWWAFEELRKRDEEKERLLKEAAEERKRLEAQAKAEKAEKRRKKEEAAAAAAARAARRQSLEQQESSISRTIVGAASNNNKNKLEQGGAVVETTGEKTNKWVDSTTVSHCFACNQSFSLTRRKHHCRVCGNVFCGDCSTGKVVVDEKAERACDACCVSDISAALENLAAADQRDADAEKEAIAAIATRSPKTVPVPHPPTATATVTTPLVTAAKPPTAPANNAPLAAPRGTSVGAAVAAAAATATTSVVSKEEEDDEEDGCDAYHHRISSDSDDEDDRDSRQGEGFHRSSSKDSDDEDNEDAACIIS